MESDDGDNECFDVVDSGMTTLFNYVRKTSNEKMKNNIVNHFKTNNFDEFISKYARVVDDKIITKVSTTLTCQTFTLNQISDSELVDKSSDEEWCCSRRKRKISTNS